MTKSNFISVFIIAPGLRRQGLEAEAPLLVNLLANIARQVTDAAVGPLVGGVFEVGIIVVHVTRAIPSIEVTGYGCSSTVVKVMLHSKVVPQLMGNNL